MAELRSFFSFNPATSLVHIHLTATGQIPAGATLGFGYYQDFEGHQLGFTTATSATNRLEFSGDIDARNGWLISGDSNYFDGKVLTSHSIRFVIEPGAGRSLFEGDSRYDFLFLGGSVDSIRTGAGDDVVYTNAGNDTVTGGTGADYVDGGAGIDVLSYIGSALGITIHLGKNQAAGGDAQGDIIAGFERVLGTTLSDNISGSTAANILKGYGGDDALYGNFGNDELIGGGGKDRIEGQKGADTLTGESGTDTFVIRTIEDSTAASSGRDTITDWYKDKIHLTYIDASTLDAGNQAFDFIGRDPFSGVAGELRYSVNLPDNSLIVYGDVNGDKVADLGIKMLGTTSLNAADFAL